MPSSVRFADRSLSFAKCTLASARARHDGLRCLVVLLCLPLMDCVGEVRKSTIGPDAATEPASGSDGGSTPVNQLPDATTASDASRPPGNDASNTGNTGNDARVVNPPVEAGTADARVPDGNGTPDAQVNTPDTGTPITGKKGVFVAVGYSGVRMVSRDGGKTWGDIKTSGGSGDDNNLLRTVSFGNGMFVAAGWKLWSSTDGANWTERTNPAGQWMGGLEFGNNMFVGAGGVGTSIYSMDGTQWMKGNDRSGEHARTVAFGNGTFIAGTDPGKWWSTANGMNWVVMSEGKNSQVMWCKGAFSTPADCTDPMGHSNGRTAFGDGVYISASGNKIERSEDGGKTWTSVKDTSETPVEDVAYGLVDQ